MIKDITDNADYRGVETVDHRVESVAHVRITTFKQFIKIMFQ